MNQRNYYIILGVAPTESPRGIRAAYRDLVKRYHPDRAGPEGKRQFQEVSEAYEVLSDPDKRIAYDRSIAKIIEAAKSGAAEVHIGPEKFGDDFKAPAGLTRGAYSLFEGPSSISPSFDALYERLLRNFTGQGMPKAERLEPLNMVLVLSEREARKGVSIPLAIPTFYTCRTCRGSGRDLFFPCIDCFGNGLIESEEVIQVEIPPMIRNGSIIEIPLHGLSIKNIFLRVHVEIEENKTVRSN